MRVIVPAMIGTAQIVSTSIAEPDTGEVLYSGSTVYLVGNTVIDTTTHKKFTSLQGVTSDVTISIATPAVVSWLAHGRIAGEYVKFVTTGALPTGITAGTQYMVTAVTPNSFGLATVATSTVINTSGTQSGVHTATVSGNQGNTLPVAPSTETLWWKETGRSNRYSAFDLYRNTATTGASPMTFRFAPGVRTGALFALGLVADQITVNVRSLSVIVHTVTQSLVTRQARNPTEYCFNPFTTSPSFIDLLLPLDAGMEVEVILTRGQGLITVGALGVGPSVYLGRTQYDAESSIENYSQVKRDDLGNATLVSVPTVPRTKQVVACDKSNTTTLYNLRRTLNAVPAVWLAMDEARDQYFEALLILGIYNQFLINVAQPDETRVTLELEEI